MLTRAVRSAAVGALALVGASSARAQYLALPSPTPCIATSGAPGAIDSLSVVVLAFNLTTKSGDLKFLADPVAEAVARRLAIFPRLRVVTREAVRRAPPVDPIRAGRLARELGARFLVTGDISPEGEGASLRLQLYNSASDSLVWTVTLSLDADQLQRSTGLAADGVAGVILGLSAKAGPLQAVSAPAYDRFLRGVDAARDRGPRALVRAVAYYRQAVGLDARFSAAQARLALTLVDAVDAGSTSLADDSDRSLQEATRAAAEAIRLDSLSALGWLARGAVLGMSAATRRDAWSAFARAQRLDTADAEVAWRYARALLRAGDRQRAEPLLRRAVALDRRYAPALTDLGDLALVRGDLRGACALLDRAILADPYRPWGYALRAVVRSRLGDQRVAWADAEMATRVGAPFSGEAAGALVDVAARDTTRARRRAARLWREHERIAHLSTLDARLVATAFTALGDEQQAVAAVGRAFPRDGLLVLGLEDTALRRLTGVPAVRRMLSEAGRGSPPPADAPRRAR